jgi:xylulokinase
MHNAGSSLEWVKDALGDLEVNLAEWLNLSPYDLFEREAERIPSGSEGLIFLPYIMGERSPHWNPNARGVFLGITRKHTRAHLLRAVYEGVALNLKSIYLALKELEVRLDEMRIIGGGAKSRLWVQILANALGVPITVTIAPLEATALGAAMVGAVGVGFVKDLRAAAERFVGLSEKVKPGPEKGAYEALYGPFLSAYEALRPVFDLLVEAAKKGGVNGEN